MESKPMKPEELGQFVCVAHGGCLGYTPPGTPWPGHDYTPPRI